jgi:hypothetical protein
MPHCGLCQFGRSCPNLAELWAFRTGVERILQNYAFAAERFRGWNTTDPAIQQRVRLTVTLTASHLEDYSRIA